MNPKMRFPTLATYKTMRNMNSNGFFKLFMQQKKRTPKNQICKLLNDKTTRGHVKFTCNGVIKIKSYIYINLEPETLKNPRIKKLF